MKPILFLVFCTAGLAQQICSCSGGISSYPAGTEPACDNSNRGTVIISLGGDGQPDQVKTCLRNGFGRFAWTPPGQQSSTSYTNVRTVGGCPVFPDNNIWNSRADALPLDAASAAIIANYADNRVGGDPNLSLNLADASTPRWNLKFDYADQSDAGRYPVTPDMRVEGYAPPAGFPVSGGPYTSDAHLLVVRTDECKLYELFALETAGPPYAAAAGAVYDLTSNNLRPDGWTSADAAGLPIWPGVLTYDEIYGAGEIRHMIRFTVNKTRNTYVWPARHFASRNTDASLPPMGRGGGSRPASMKPPARRTSIPGRPSRRRCNG